MKNAGIIALTLLGLASGFAVQNGPASAVSHARQEPAKPQSRPNFNGRWEGVQVIQTEMPRVVADLVFTIKDAGAEISGETTFHSRARQGKGKWQPAGNFGGPMQSPHVEGKTLLFKLSFRTRDGLEKTMDYKMEITGPDQAIFDYVEATATDMSAKMMRKQEK